MRGNVGFILLFIVMLAVTTIAGFYMVMFSQNSNVNKRAIVCRNDGPTISFLINEKTQEIIMLGEVIDPSSINIFNKAAISAAWSHKGADTKIFLDRIAGQLEVETSKANGKIDKQKFECSNTNIRF